MAIPRRGFSLVIVIVLGLAAFIVASTLVVVSESAGTRVAHSVQGNRATAIAEAGMERARSYVQAVTAGGVDYDLVLDPDLEANCSGLPVSPATVPAGSQALRPKLTDGTRVPYRGKDWTLVPYDGGAYLIRFEDDTDDFRTQSPAWDDYTGNTLALPNNCREGPTALGTADNPFRDRNQTISITVIGIAPGTDPERAVHRTTLRRMETFPGLAQVAGIQVRGNINVAGNANLNACSPIASMQVDGNLTGDGSGSGCGCGESRADSVSTEWSHCSAGTTCSAVGCLAGTMGTPGPSVPSVLSFDSGPGVDFYFDWSAPDTGATPRQGSCIFRVEASTMWWWDPMADRGPAGARCSTFEGTATVLPAVDPADTVGFGSCWTPILANTTSTMTAIDSVETDGTVWRPRDLEVSFSGSTANTFTGSVPSAFPAGATLRKPDWRDCKVIGHPAGGPLECATCDGTHAAMRAGSQLWFSGDSPDELTAIPAGIYIYTVDINLTGAGDAMNAPQPNTTTFTPSEWPLMTVATTGNLNINARTIFGLSGRGDAAYPAIITNGTIDIQASNDNLIGGSVWGRGNWLWRGSSANFFFGELHLNGNWEMSGSSDFFWNYQNQLSTAQILPTPTAPTHSRSLD